MAAPGGRGGAAAAEEEEEGCDLFQCFCKWRKRCSPRIPWVSPGRDYVCISSDASGDSTPKWSVLVGCTSGDEPFHNLRTHRFRVSDSGRVMGCSDDMLERFRGVSPDDNEHTVFSAATAAMAPNGRNMCIICAHSPSFDQRSTGTGTGGGGGGEQDIGLLPKAFLMDCVDKSLTALPPIPFPHGSYQSVSAHGELWTPATVEDPGPSGVKRRLLVYRLDGASNSWAKISDIDFPYRRPSVNIFCGGPLLQGYAVIRDRFILMSFIDLSFFCFDCASSTLTRVTTEDETIQYVPIRGRAAHVADNDNGIYFIERGTLFRYNYSPEGDKPLKPPEVIDAICPYRKEGYGFVLHLRNGMLCAVWMNMNMPCKCATRHVLITTFRVECQLDKDGFEPKVLEVLHSTCRRIGMLRSKAPGHESYDRLCFIQEYLDDSPEIDPSIASMMGARSSHPEADAVNPKILFCCREFLSRRELSSCVVLEECRVMVKSEFRFICQSGQHTFVYKISTSRGKLTCHETILEAELSLETIRNGDVGIDDPPAWHFVNYGMKLYVIPSIPQYNHYEVDVHRNSYLILESKRPSICFSAVCRVGQQIVALGDTLEAVYILDQQNMEWVFCKTSSRSLDLRKKIMISGFVDLGDDSMMISEVDACECFMLDLKKGQWFVVEPPYGDIWQYCVGLLSGTCMFIEGFIYTCSDGEMVAYELIEKDGLCYWDAPVILKLPWKMFSNRKFMAFSPICKDVIHDDIAFSIVEARPFGSSHTVATTIVQVKLQETTRGTKRPVEIDHVDISMSSIEQNGWILSNYAFTL